MFRRLAFLTILVTASWSWCADWQVGRIQEVRKDTSSKTLYYVVNTPVTEDVVTYTISVHVKDRLVTGFYELDKLQGAPPEEWAENTPVWVGIEEKTLRLKSATSSELKLTISKTKSASMMAPLTLEEIKIMNRGAQQSPENSTIGFGAKEAAKAREASASPPAAPSPGGTISVSTVPYLADVFVDNKDMGYSPVKIRLSPGKHLLRVSKNGYRPFVKEVVVAVDTEQKVDVTLEKK